MSGERVFLGLGSNLGEREGTLRLACSELQAGGFALVSSSSLYLTEPVGGPPQGWYLNAVVEGRTALGPRALLGLALSAERTRGRVRAFRNAPRTLDVDLLLYGEACTREPDLTLPHPRLHERRFVLVPLTEIAPDLRHPVLGRTMSELLDTCPDRSEVRPHVPAASWR